MVKLRAIARLAATLIAEGHRVLWSHCGLGFNRPFVAGLIMIEMGMPGLKWSPARGAAAGRLVQRRVRRLSRAMISGCSRPEPLSAGIERPAGLVGTGVAVSFRMGTILLVILILCSLARSPHGHTAGAGATDPAAASASSSLCWCSF
jgi:hypothetical protein